MKTMPRAMNSEHEELAKRYADECARTLLAYYRTELQTRCSAEGDCDRTWRAHRAAVERYEGTFPRLVDWQELAEPALMSAIEGAKP